jgi:hypothetical protein
MISGTLKAKNILTYEMWSNRAVEKLDNSEVHNIVRMVKPAVIKWPWYVPPMGGGGEEVKNARIFALGKPEGMLRPSKVTCTSDIQTDLER